MKGTGLVLRVVCLGLLAAPAGAAEEAKKAHGETGSRAEFSHRIMILDEDGNGINLPAPGPATTKPAAAPQLKPYAPATTCGKCHDYAQINTGWHFNSNRTDVLAGRPGEPWVLTDLTTRTQLPISYRGWKGTWKPGDIGISDWQFTLQFAAHLPGGGPSETPATQPVEKKAMWPLSGKLQNDCLICHMGDSSYSTGDREIQLRQQNFRYAPARAAGLANITGSVSEIVSSAEEEGEDPLKSKRTPRMTYDASRFSPDNRVFFDIKKSTPSNCYFCHTTNVVGPGGSEAWHTDEDVHLTSGMQCADCHRHGLDHKIVRGYEGEAEVRKDPAAAALTCRGCHYGDEHGETPTVALGGKLGAPHPEHKGLPPIHLEKLSCTACHSGPWPGDKPVMLQTSLAHGLGLESFTRNAKTPPYIVGPVYLRGEDGKIAPHKVIWPSFWGRLNGQKVTPLTPTAVKLAVKNLLPAMTETTADNFAPLSEDQISKSLAALAGQKDAGEPVYVVGGKMVRRGADGKLTSESNPAAEPYAWPLAHEIRPAPQALGARGCSDCHSTDSPIYFGTVAAAGPVDPNKATVKAMYELRGDSGVLARTFAWSFTFRTMLKVISVASVAVLLGLLLAYILGGLGGYRRIVR